MLVYCACFGSLIVAFEDTEHDQFLANYFSYFIINLQLNLFYCDKPVSVACQ